MKDIEWMNAGQLFVVFIQLCILVFQSWFLHGTLIATKISADAAKKNADIAEKSVTNLERPYILVDAIAPQIKEHMGGISHATNPPQLVVSLKNFGRSPAVILEVRGSLQIIQPGADPFVIPVISLGNTLVIGSHEKWERTFRCSDPVGEGLKSQIEREEYHFWFYLSVNYEDMLSKQHYTKLRFQYILRDNEFRMQHADKYTIRT